MFPPDRNFGVELLYTLDSAGGNMEDEYDVVTDEDIDVNVNEEESSDSLVGNGIAKKNSSGESLEWSLVRLEGSFEGGDFPDSYALVIERHDGNDMSKQDLISAVNKEVERIKNTYDEKEYKVKITGLTQWLSRCLNIDAAAFYNPGSFSDAMKVAEASVESIFKPSAQVEQDALYETVLSSDEGRADT